MAKRIRLSDDNGTTWYTLPGNTGSFNHTAGSLNDTIFGQDFESAEVGIIGWTVSSNAVFKGFAGYIATLKESGTPVVAAGEAMSLVSGKTYRIDDSTKEIWDQPTGVTVYDNAVAVATTNIESIDYLFGRVTFTSGYTPTTPITIDVSYVPVTPIAGANSFNLTQSSNAVDITDMAYAQANSGHREFSYGLKTVTLELSGFYDSVADQLAKLLARNTIVVEINPDGNSESIMRGFFNLLTDELSGDVGNPEEESLSFSLSVPDDDLLFSPISWDFITNATINQAVKIAIQSWENSATIDMQYLPDGTTGKRGDCIVDEISLAGGLEVMSEFTVSLTGVGAVTSV